MEAGHTPIVVRWNSLTQAAVKVRPFFWQSHSLNLQQEWEWSEKIEKKLAEKTVCLSCFCVCSGLCIEIRVRQSKFSKLEVARATQRVSDGTRREQIMDKPD